MGERLWQKVKSCSESRSFAHEYLDQMMARAGLTPGEVDLIFSLAHSPRREDELFGAGLFLNEEEAKVSARGLLRKNLARWMSGSPRLLGLSDWAYLEQFFGESEDGGRIVKGLRSLARIASTASYGMNLNPGLGIASGHVEHLGTFSSLLNTFEASLPQVEIRAPSRCNINCLYCYYQKDFGRSRGENVESQVARAKALGVRKVTVNGGEFTIREDNLQTLEKIAQAGFKEIEVFTNGLMFYQERVLTDFLRRGTTGLFLHVSAVDERGYEMLSRRRGSYQALTRALRNIARHPDISLTVFTVLNRFNLKHLRSIVEYFQEFNAKYRFRRFFHYLGNYCAYSANSNAWEKRKSLMPRMEEAAVAVKGVLDSTSGPPNVLYGRIPFCQMQGLESRNYDLYQIMAGFYQSGVGQVEENSFLETVFTKKESCRECVHDAYCPGIMRGYARAYGTEEFRPVKTYKGNEKR